MSRVGAYSIFFSRLFCLSHDNRKNTPVGKLPSQVPNDSLLSFFCLSLPLFFFPFPTKAASCVSPPIWVATHSPTVAVTCTNEANLLRRPLLSAVHLVPYLRAGGLIRGPPVALRGAEGTEAAATTATGRKHRCGHQQSREDGLGRGFEGGDTQGRTSSQGE